MPRQVKIGDPVTDHFSVFEDDGFTKHSGLGPASFSSILYLNSVVVALPVTITELGLTGEYAFQFTPNALGDWDLEIHILYNDDIFADSFEAVTELDASLILGILDQCEKIDLAPTEHPSVVETGSLMDRLMNKNTGKTYNQTTDSLEAQRDELEIIKGLLHHNAMLDQQVYSNGLLMSARLRMFDSALHVPVNPGGSETLGLVAEFQIGSAYDITGLNTKFTLKRVYP